MRVSGLVTAAVTALDWARFRPWSSSSSFWRSFSVYPTAAEPFSTSRQ